MRSTAPTGRLRGPAWVMGPAGRLRDRAVRRLHEVSLSARLVAIVTSLLVVALLATGVVTVALLQRVLVHQVDEDLTSVARNTAVLGGVVESARASASGGPAMPADAPSDYIVQVNASDGSQALRFQPPNQSGDLLPPVTLARAVALNGAPFTIDADDDEMLRAVAVAVQQTPSSQSPLVVVTVARSLAPSQRAVSAAAAWFVVVGVVVATAGALLGAAAVRRAFRPLRGVEAVATSFGDGDTSPRVRETPATTEVGRLGLAVNAMLDRIETSLAEREASEERMRRFVADASHELRTPLAAVRGFAELHRMGALRTDDDVSGAFSRVEHEATRMGVLVEDLLLLARLDEQRPLRRESVDLLALAVDARTDAGALAPDREVTVVGAADGQRPAPAVALGDEARLRQVVANLLANALRHTPAGTPVEVGAGVREGFAVLRVVDHGHGVDPADATRVFERFYRADPSRARHQGGGSGLGLAIVAAVVAAHGGAVRLVATPGGGATAEVALPLARPGADDIPGPDDLDDAQALDGPDGVDRTDGADGAPSAGGASTGGASTAPGPWVTGAALRDDPSAGSTGPRPAADGQAAPGRSGAVPALLARAIRRGAQNRPGRGADGARRVGARAAGTVRQTVGRVRRRR